jgi:hypothetical protein
MACDYHRPENFAKFLGNSFALPVCTSVARQRGGRRGNRLAGYLDSIRIRMEVTT